MATYVCKQDCSYGRKGDLVEVEGKLTDRQAQLLVQDKREAPKPVEKKVATGKANDAKSDHGKK